MVHILDHISITISDHVVIGRDGVDGRHQRHDALELSGAGVATCRANISLELFDLVFDEQILCTEDA